MSKHGMKYPIIAIDGPAAAGKGTLARQLAEVLALPYLDTGLLYRAVARRVLNQGGDPAHDGPEQARQLMPEDMRRDDLRTPEVDRAASLVAKEPEVRAALLERQRLFARARGAVVDGRDIGTVVFPQATAKFFITASPEVRAQRRYIQRYGQSCTDSAALAAEVAAINARDGQDASRQTAPLRPAEDAVQILTDGLDDAAVLEKVCQILQEKGIIRV
ncbi:MAG: cytidylate kinase [Bifidobacteriales bacterium]|nr:cytidylate kinase [Bifidobacteriales bacterium]